MNLMLRVIVDFTFLIACLLLLVSACHGAQNIADQTTTYTPACGGECN